MNYNKIFMMLVLFYSVILFAPTPIDAQEEKDTEITMRHEILAYQSHTGEIRRYGFDSTSNESVLNNLPDQWEILQLDMTADGDTVVYCYGQLVAALHVPRDITFGAIGFDADIPNFEETTRAAACRVKISDDEMRFAVLLTTDDRWTLTEYDLSGGERVDSIEGSTHPHHLIRPFFPRQFPYISDDRLTIAKHDAFVHWNRASNDVTTEPLPDNIRWNIPLPDILPLTDTWVRTAANDSQYALLEIIDGDTNEAQVIYQADNTAIGINWAGFIEGGQRILIYADQQQLPEPPNWRAVFAIDRAGNVEQIDLPIDPMNFLKFTATNDGFFFVEYEYGDEETRQTLYHWHEGSITEVDRFVCPANTSSWAFVLPAMNVSNNLESLPNFTPIDSLNS